jgi:hypothetical protein
MNWPMLKVDNTFLVAAVDVTDVMNTTSSATILSIFMQIRWAKS